MYVLWETQDTRHKTQDTRHKTQAFSLLFFLFFYCTVNGQTDGQVLTLVQGGASWADASGADGDAWGVSNDNDQSINITRTGSVHVGTHGNVTGYEFSVSDDNGGGILLMDDNANNETTDGETLGIISFDASDDRSTLGASAMIIAGASVDHTSTSKGANLWFSTKSNTTGSADGASQRMIITHDGKVGINTSAVGGPTSTLHTNGSVAYAVDNFTATSTNSYDMGDDNYLLLANTANSDAVINLPAASTCEGRVYQFIKTDVNNSLDFNNTTIRTSPTATQTIWSGPSRQLKVISTGTEWYLLF